MPDLLQLDHRLWSLEFEFVKPPARQLLPCGSVGDFAHYDARVSINERPRQIDDVTERQTLATSPKHSMITLRGHACKDH